VKPRTCARNKTTSTQAQAHKARRHAAQALQTAPFPLLNLSISQIGVASCRPKRSGLGPHIAIYPLANCAADGTHGGSASSRTNARSQSDRGRGFHPWLRRLVCLSTELSHVHLVDDQVLQGDLERPVALPVEGGFTLRQDAGRLRPSAPQSRDVGAGVVQVLRRVRAHDSKASDAVLMRLLRRSRCTPAAAVPRARA
jgi:hypothetical protein